MRRNFLFIVAYHLHETLANYWWPDSHHPDHFPMLCTVTIGSPTCGVKSWILAAIIFFFLSGPSTLVLVLECRYHTPYHDGVRTAPPQNGLKPYFVFSVSYVFCLSLVIVCARVLVVSRHFKKNCYYIQLRF